ALRMSQVMPAGARLCSIEFSAANAAIARRIWDHAGVGDQLTVVVGTLGDGGSTIEALEKEHGFSEGAVDFVFLTMTRTRTFRIWSGSSRSGGFTPNRSSWPTT